jgi:hypothetical protein
VVGLKFVFRKLGLGLRWFWFKEGEVGTDGRRLQQAIIQEKKQIRVRFACKIKRCLSKRVLVAIDFG